MKALVMFLMMVSLAWAHEGHDHGTEAKPVGSGIAPRFEAKSELFSLLGVLTADGWTLYLNRQDDNAPVSKAGIEIEGAFSGRAGETAPGIYRFKPAAAVRGGEALTLTVTSGDEADLLTAVLPAPTFGKSGPQVDSSQRLADGSLFVPRAVQNLLGLRIAPAAAGSFARRVELPGRVIADPAAGGRVQATQPGTIAAHPRGIALVGQRVRKGEVLAYLVPSLDAAARAEKLSGSAELAARSAMMEKRLARLEQLEGSVPRREIEQARIELESLRARQQALQGAISGRVALLAPVAGVVAASHVGVGQVVEAKEMLFEIVDPQRLAVEAQAFDPAVTAGLGAATARVGDVSLALDFVGAGRSLREQSLPVLFRVRGGDALLAVGQTLKVLAETKGRLEGIAIPAAAITRNSANEATVWVQEGTERFQARRVKALPLDAGRVLVTGGLAGGERIVGTSAQALGQIR